MSEGSPGGTGGRVESLRSGTETAARVADVLLLFTRGPAALGVSEIARQLGLSKAVVHRILQSLASRSLVEVQHARSAADGQPGRRQ